MPPNFERALAERTAYVELRVGDYAHDLGLLDRLVALGATVQEVRRERDEGFVTASVVGPFGNVLGIMENPHYLEVLARDRADS